MSAPDWTGPYRDRAVVLRTYRLGEADRIVVLLGRDHGKIRGVAKGGAAHPQPAFRVPAGAHRVRQHLAVAGAG